MSSASSHVVKLHRTIGVRVGAVQVGGGAPVVVQSMTMTDTADAAATARQCIELAEAGSEMVRVTVNTPDAFRGRCSGSGVSVIAMALAVIVTVTGLLPANASETIS